MRTTPKRFHYDELLSPVRGRKTINDAVADDAMRQDQDKVEFGAVEK